VLAALVLLTVATYAPVWRFDFVAVDDPQYVYANPDLAAGLTPASVAWAFTTGHEANWHPITWLSHALDIQLFGLAAGRHHTTNLLLHVASTLLLFGLLRTMTGSVFRSAIVAALFAVHPLHVESVAWVAERKDVLSGFFFMLTVWAYVRYTRAPGIARYLLVALCLVLGLMAKAMLVTVPLLFLLLDYWPLERSTRLRQGYGGQDRHGQGSGGQEGPWRALVIEKVPLLGIIAASSVITFVVQRQGGAVKSLALIPLSIRFQNAVVSYVDYLRDVVWPARLGVFYPFPTSLPAERVAIAAAILLGLTAIVWRLRRRAPFAIVGWLWFAGMLVPVSGIAQVGAHARADRFMYLPLIGLSIAVVWSAAAWLRTDASKRMALMVAGVVVAANAVVAHGQVQYWRNTETLWRHDAEVTDSPNNFGVYFSLAEYLRTTGRPADAIPSYEAAIARNPGYMEARLGLVRALTETKQPDRAAAALADVVRVAPDNADARMSLGSTLVELGKLPEAAAQFAEVVRLQPDKAEPHWRLAVALAQTGRLIDALPEFSEAVRLDPSSAPIRNDYGFALAQHGQTAAGIAQLTESLRLKPDFVDAHHNLGRLLVAENRLPEALGHLAEAVRLEPDFIDARMSLALTLIRAGRVDDGAKELREVIARDPGNAMARRALVAIGR